MRKQFFIFFTCFIFFLPINLHAQSIEPIDSINADLFHALSTEKDKTKRMHLHEELGKNFNMIDWEQAKEHFQKAAHIAKELDLTSDLYYYIERLSSIDTRIGNFQEALKILDQYLPEVEASKDSIIIPFHFNLGFTYLQIRSYQDAITHFAAVNRYAKEFDKPKSSIQVIGLLGDVYAHQGKYQKALTQKRLALRETAKVVELEAIMGYIYKDIATLHIQLQNLDSAEVYVKKALKASEEDHEYLPIAGEAYVVYNKILQERGEFPQAIEAAEKAKAMAQKTHASIVEWKSSQALAETYLRSNNYDQGLIAAYQAQTLAISLDNKEKLAKTYGVLQNLYERKNEFEQAYQYQSKAYEAEAAFNSYLKDLEKQKLDYLQKREELKIQEVMSSHENQFFTFSKLYGLTFFILIITIIVLLATFSKKPLFERIEIDEDMNLLEAKLKIRFIKHSSLMMSILITIILTYHFIWGAYEGMLVASLFLILVGGLGLFANLKTLTATFWIFIVGGYSILLTFPLVSTPVYSGFLGLVTVYLTLNYLADRGVQYIANLFVLFISFVVYLYFIHINEARINVESLGLEAISAISCIIGIVAVRYYSTTHTQIVRKELRKSRLFLEEISDINPFAIISMDLYSRVTYVNNVALEHLGVAKEKLRGKTVKSVVESTLLKCPWDLDEKITNEGITVFSPSFLIPTKEGKDRYFDIIKKPIYNEKGVITGALMVGIDTTEKRKAQKSLEEREMILNSIINTIPDPVFVMGNDMEWEIHNKAFPVYMRRVFGKEISIEPGWAKRSPFLKNGTWNYNIPNLPVNESYSELIEFNAKDGSIISMDMYQSPLKDKDNQKIGILFLGRDQSEKIAQKKLITQQMQVLNEKNAELKKYIESNSHLEQFAYLASHDLRTPIRTLVSFTQLLERRTKDVIGDEEKEYMKFIIRASKNMMILVDDILSFSRVNTSKVKLKEIDVKQLLEETLEEIQVPISEKEAIISIGELPESIVADAVKMRQLFQNLISNALKFSKAHIQPKIHIYGELEQHAWRFWVEDNGIGIEKEYQKRIFLLFNRLHSDIEIEGFGIGLASCKKILEQHNGEIGLTSEIGKGSRFYFTIPLPCQTPPSLTETKTTVVKMSEIDILSKNLSSLK